MLDEGKETDLPAWRADTGVSSATPEAVEPSHAEAPPGPQVEAQEADLAAHPSTLEIASSSDDVSYI
jgi:hypothetical protein